LGVRCKLPQWGSRRIELRALRAQKTRLVAANVVSFLFYRFDSAFGALLLMLKCGFNKLLSSNLRFLGDTTPKCPRLSPWHYMQCWLLSQTRLYRPTLGRLSLQKGLFLVHPEETVNKCGLSEENYDLIVSTTRGGSVKYLGALPTVPSFPSAPFPSPILSLSLSIVSLSFRSPPWPFSSPPFPTLYSFPFPKSN